MCRIQLRGLFELGLGNSEVASRERSSPLLEALEGCGKAGLLELQLVLNIRGVLFQGLPVVLHGSLVVLQDLRFMALLVSLSGGAACGNQDNDNERAQSFESIIRFHR